MNQLAVVKHGSASCATMYCNLLCDELFAHETDPSRKGLEPGCGDTTGAEGPRSESKSLSTETRRCLHAMVKQQLNETVLPGMHGFVDACLDIRATRGVIDAQSDASDEAAGFTRTPVFIKEMPNALPELTSHVLRPSAFCADKTGCAAGAAKLAARR